MIEVDCIFDLENIKRDKAKVVLILQKNNRRNLK